MKREFKIGIFLAGTLFILALFIFFVGDLSKMFRKEGYTLYANFESVAGLEKSAVIRIAGVKAGFVKDIRLERGQAQVVMSINPGVEVPRGSRATLAALGLLGEKYIEIRPGKEKDFYQPGETVEVVPSVSFEQMGTLLSSIGDQIQQTAESLNEMVGGESGTHFRGTLQNLSSLTADLKELVGASKGDVNRSLQTTSRAIETFDQKVGEVSKNLEELISLMRDTVDENRENIKINLESFKELIDKTEESLRLLNESLEKINRGEGSLGKVINEPELYDDARQTMGDVRRMVQPLSKIRFSSGLRADYFGESELLKSMLTFRLWPTQDKYLLAQIVRDPWLDKFTYSAQGGVRWGPVSPRAGIMESKFGAAVDYYAFQDRFMVSFESFDFNRQPRPRMRLWTRYSVSKYLYLLLGVEDFTLAPQREVFFGFGLGLS